MKNNNTNVKGRAYYQSLRAKYLSLAKEASVSGDRVLSEYNLQFAEHYGRILSEKFPQIVQQNQQQSQQNRPQQPQPTSPKTEPQAETCEPSQDQVKTEEQPVKESPKKKKTIVRRKTQKQPEVVAES